MTPVLLEHARAQVQPCRQFGGELVETVHAVHVAAERQVTGLDQYVLGAEAKDGVGMGADEHPRGCHVAQQRIEPVAAASAFDRVVPDQHDRHPPQLSCHFVSEIVVVDGRLGLHTGGRERCEQGREAALGRIGAVARCPIAGIEQGDGSRIQAVHGFAFMQFVAPNRYGVVGA